MAEARQALFGEEVGDRGDEAMLYARSAIRALFRSELGLAAYEVVAAGLEVWD